LPVNADGVSNTFEPLLALAAADDLADLPGASTSIAAIVRPSSFTRM
jgi:hypothetical protein